MAKGFGLLILVTGLIVVTFVQPYMSADGPLEPVSVTPFSKADSALKEVSFALPRSGGTRIDEGRHRWALPPVDILFPAGIGFALGALFLVWYSISIGKSLGTGNWTRTILVLARNPFAVVWSLLFATIAALGHTGAFSYLSDKTTSLPFVAALQTSVGGTALLGIIVKVTRQLWKPAWLDDAVAVAGGDVSSIKDVVAEVKNNAWFIALFQYQLEKEKERKISRLALNHNLGLIQKAIYLFIEDALNHARMEPAIHSQIVKDLQGLETATHPRTRFVSSRLAIKILCELKELDAIEDWLATVEERQVERRGQVVSFDQERRRHDRRAYSPWVAGSVR
jgi:hypothetical protein